MEKYTAQQPQGFLKKIENFWFYHKWHILVLLLILCMLFVGIHSCANKDSIDMYVLYMINGAYSTETNQELAKKLENYVQDIDGDGEKRVQIITVSFSDVLERTDRTQESTLTRLTGQVASGPALFYIFDEENYQALKDAKVQILGNLDFVGIDSECLDADRYFAGKAGFFDDISGFETKGKTLYFGVRNYQEIPETDPRYPQIEQCQKTLTAICKDYN